MSEKRKSAGRLFVFIAPVFARFILLKWPPKSRDYYTVSLGLNIGPIIPTIQIKYRGV